MKKLFVLCLMTFLALMAFSPPATCSTDPVIKTEQLALAPAVPLPVAYMFTAPSPVSDAYIAQEGEVTGDDTVTSEDTSFWDLIKDNWLTIVLGLLGFFELIARLTPTTKDDSIISWLIKILNLIFPNQKAGGGVHISNVKSQQTK